MNKIEQHVGMPKAKKSEKESWDYIYFNGQERRGGVIEPKHFNFRSFVENKAFFGATRTLFGAHLPSINAALEVVAKIKHQQRDLFIEKYLLYDVILLCLS